MGRREEVFVEYGGGREWPLVSEGWGAGGGCGVEVGVGLDLLAALLADGLRR